MSASTDLVQAVRSTIEKNRNIPAELDALGEFIDSPIGKLELGSLYDVFGMILDNLAVRFPDVASKKAANDARVQVTNFLSLANNDAERVKAALRNELRTVVQIMSQSISERFSRMNSDEKRAIDATLRLIRRSQFELVFRVEMGKHIIDAGSEFERFFAAVRAESPNIRELRYENLIVEKGIFNKLLLKSESKKDYTIWVPSFFAKESIDFLIERVAPLSEHILLERLREMDKQGKIETIRPFLEAVSQSMGVLSTDAPEELRDFVHSSPGTRYPAIAPIDLDDIQVLEEETAREKKERERQRSEEERQRQEALRAEKDQKTTQFRARQEQVAITVQKEKQVERQLPTGNSVYLGKELDLEQLTKALSRRVPEKDFPSQVREIGNYYLDVSAISSSGLAVVGSSGSGKSVTVRRILDGIADKPNISKLIVIDQKGEHRGVAWKRMWDVFALVSDSQAKKFMIPLEKQDEQDSELVADFIQEWFLQMGLVCNDQQRARIASIVRSISGNAVDFATLGASISGEPDLAQLGQKFSKSFSSRPIVSKIFSNSNSVSLGVQSDRLLFDLSGRGLKDPTTKEDRIIISALLLRLLSRSSLSGCVIVIEDLLDRLKSTSLRRQVLDLVAKLRSSGNAIVATSRSNIREFIGPECVEILHRISGEKIVNEELQGFKSGNLRNLGQLITFLPRGYAITSQVKHHPPAGIKVEELRFS